MRKHNGVLNAKLTPKTVFEVGLVQIVEKLSNDGSNAKMMIRNMK